MKLLIIPFLLVIAMTVSAQADRKHIRQGNGNYNEDNYKDAEKEYRKALEINPAASRADYNLGNSLYKQGQFDAAAGRYNELINKSHAERSRSESSRSATPPAGHAELSRSEASAPNSTELSRYYYNLGNSLFQAQKYRESIEAYKMSLRNNPSDLDAKHNLQMAMRLMHEAEQQKQQKGNNDQQKQDKNNQEQKQQQQQSGNDPKNDQQQKDEQSQQNEQNAQQEDKQQQQNEPRGINPQDAERILDALENQEKETLKAVKDNKETHQTDVEKNW